MCASATNLKFSIQVNIMFWVIIENSSFIFSTSKWGVVGENLMISLFIQKFILYKYDANYI